MGGAQGVDHHQGGLPAWTLDTWEMRPESATRVGHPAPFPLELPRRLIELYTYRGDVVLDPFMPRRGASRGTRPTIGSSSPG